MDSDRTNTDIYTTDADTVPTIKQNKSFTSSTNLKTSTSLQDKNEINPKKDYLSFNNLWSKAGRDNYCFNCAGVLNESGTNKNGYFSLGVRRRSKCSASKVPQRTAEEVGETKLVSTSNPGVKKDSEAQEMPCVALTCANASAEADTNTKSEDQGDAQLSPEQSKTLTSSGLSDTTRITIPNMLSSEMEVQSVNVCACVRPCTSPPVCPCECLCPCPRPCTTCTQQQHHHFLPVTQCARPSSIGCGSNHGNISKLSGACTIVLSNHFWRSLYPSSPHSKECRLDTSVITKLKEYNCSRSSGPEYEQDSISNSNIRVTDQPPSVLPSKRKPNLKIFDAEQNNFYSKPATRAPSALRLTTHDASLFINQLSQTDPNPQTTGSSFGLRASQSVPLQTWLKNPIAAGMPRSKSSLKSKSSTKKISKPVPVPVPVPVETGFLSKLRIRAPVGGGNTGKGALTLGTKAFSRSKNLPPVETDPKEKEERKERKEKDKERKQPREGEGGDGSSGSDDSDTTKGAKRKSDKERRRFKYKNILDQPQTINLGTKLKTHSAKFDKNQRHEYGKARSFIDEEFMKIRQKRVPVVWIYGYTQISIASAKRDVVNQLAEERDYYIMNLDYEMRRLHGFDKVIAGNRQLTSQIQTRLFSILNKIFQSNDASLTTQEIVEILKIAILVSQTGPNPPRGYIMDAFPLDADEARTFEKIVWPAVLGLYFMSGAWVEIKSEPPPCIQPKLYVRSTDYFEEEVEAVVDAYGFKSIKITYAEQLKGQVLDHFMQFMEDILIKHIVGSGGTV